MLNETQVWQQALINMIKDPAELLAMLELDQAYLEPAKLAANLFPLKVPRSFVARMQKRNPDDPLLKQVLPLGIEQQEIDGFETDPLKESESNPVPGLLHKYHSRVLVTLTGACAVHCRYCFRRHFPYEANTPGRKGWGQILDYITNNSSINEVILSGGDPLAVSDALLESFIQQLADISHVQLLRVHSRIPVVMPERMTSSLINILSTGRFATTIVIHANHPQELNELVTQPLQRCRQAGIHLLNQSVLLKGVNDDAGVLIQLSKDLFTAGVMPYYLHTLDKVQGAAHFAISMSKTSEIYKEICSKLSGYLVPKLVCEEPGASSKTMLSTDLFTV